MRTIYCPGVERHVSLRAFNAGIKRAKAHPDAEFKQGITCWWPCTGRKILRQFFNGVQRRITRAIPISHLGPCPTVPERTDRRSTSRLLKHIWRAGRECKWCGAHFTPRTVNDTCCCPDCYRAYRGP